MKMYNHKNKAKNIRKNSYAITQSVKYKNKTHSHVAGSQPLRYARQHLDLL